ncbi:MAG: hypothetical protein AAF680_07910, partial [Pseudomonadota bacterium]
RLIHKSGVYFLWAYPYSVYWWNIFYYEEPRTLDYLFFWAGFLAYAVRIAAWAKLRRQHARKRAVTSGAAAPQGAVHLAKTGLGFALVALGLTAAATGRQWQEAVSKVLLSPSWSAELELWLPYWPLQPFLPLFILALAALCLAPSSRTSRKTDEPMRVKKEALSVNA